MVAVSLFSSVAPDNFEVFDKAFVTLFHVTSGDPWPETLPSFNEDGLRLAVLFMNHCE